jgi:outer membrane lipoprotein SlyB
MRQVRAALAIFATIWLSGCVEQVPAAIEIGHVIAVQPADQAAENTGAGGVAGVVLGTALGAAIGGRGTAEVVGALIGAAAGGTAGTAVEGASQPTTGIAYTIKLSDGRVITVVERHAATDSVYPVGSPVAAETRGRTQHVTQVCGVRGSQSAGRSCP